MRRPSNGRGPWQRSLRPNTPTSRRGESAKRDRHHRGWSWTQGARISREEKLSSQTTSSAQVERSRRLLGLARRKEQSECSLSALTQSSQRAQFNWSKPPESP